MGCISSKIVRRAVSFNEDYYLNHSHSIRKRNMGHLLQDLIIFTPHSATTDHLLADLDCTDTIASKQEDEMETATTEVEPPVSCIVNTWELMQGLEEHELEQLVLNKLQDSSDSATPDLEDADDDVLKKSRRSRSCQLLSEDMKIELTEELGNMGSVFVRSRSTSFHTVEEYDAMLRNIWLSSGPNNDHQSSEFLNHNDVDDTQETASTSSNSDSKVEKRICEKGLRRRAIAKGLESLEIPSTTISSIEFPTPAMLRSFRKWADVDSSGDASSSYVTPKFGSYNVSSCSSRFHKEDGMLNPELLAAFEECMQQLQMEEDNLLQQMSEANDRMHIEAKKNDDLLEADDD